MSVEHAGAVHIQALKPPKVPVKQPNLIQLEDIKAILYLGLRGEVSLLTENRKVDILA